MDLIRKPASRSLCLEQVDNEPEILPRAKAICEYITRSWDVLSTISAEGFEALNAPSMYDDVIALLSR
jgi:tryptophan 2,3-dioxygenase